MVSLLVLNYRHPLVSLPQVDWVLIYLIGVAMDPFRLSTYLLTKYVLWVHILLQMILLVFHVVLVNTVTVSSPPHAPTVKLEHFRIHLEHLFVSFATLVLIVILLDRPSVKNVHLVPIRL